MLFFIPSTALRIQRLLVILSGGVRTGTKAVTWCLNLPYLWYGTEMCFSKNMKIWDSFFHLVLCQAIRLFNSIESQT